MTGRRLAGKTVVITGAGRGIGQAYALAMARAGARVVANDINVDLAEVVVSEIEVAGGEALVDDHDISDPDAAMALVAAARDAFGGLDALVNNAAVHFSRAIEAHSAEDWDRVMAINARGTFNCGRAVTPVFRQQGGGAILNTTSGAFWEGTAGVAAYAASKAAVFALTLTQHTELAAEGIRSNCIAPNATRTRMLDEWLLQLSKSSGRAEAELAAEYGIQEPENLAPLAIFLCSDAARGISGRVLEVWDDRISVVEPPTRGIDLVRTGDAWQVEDLVARLPNLLNQAPDVK